MIEGNSFNLDNFASGASPFLIAQAVRNRRIERREGRIEGFKLDGFFLIPGQPGHNGDLRVGSGIFRQEPGGGGGRFKRNHPAPDADQFGGQHRKIAQVGPDVNYNLARFQEFHKKSA